MATNIEETVERVLHEKFGHFLEDISFRIDQAYDIAGRAGGGRGTVFAEDLNVPNRVFMTGYTITNNSPSAGSIAWVDIHMVYNGQDYAITNASTANKYVWWSPSVTPTTLQSSNVKPTLAQGEVLVFINSGGAAKVMLSDTNQSLPSVVADGAVDSSAILANAVGSAQLADGAVGSTQLGANAVTAGKISDGAVVRSAQLGTGVVAAGALQANAVGSAALADNAVVRAGQLGTGVVGNGALAANAVTNAKLADGAIVRAGQLSANVVASGAIQANAVTNTQLAGGAVQATNLNILRHVMY